MKTVYKYVQKFQATSFILDRKRAQRRYMLTDEKLNETSARAETSPCVSPSSAKTARELLHLHPYKTTVVHSHCHSQ